MAHLNAAFSPVAWQRRLGRTLAACLFGLALLAVIRWKATLASLGNYLVCTSDPRPADLILVLGGEFYGERVVRAAELAGHHYAPKVLISGPLYNGRPEGELAIQFLAQRGYTSGVFESFRHVAHSTIGEALALRPELIRRRVKRVILVTSAYHSRRARTVLRFFCPGIDFISVPAPDNYYHPDQWWEDESSRRLFFSEWSKLTGSVFLALVERSQ